MPNIPDIVQLNAQSCEHNVLLLLRVLNTSDLTFFYALLSDSSRAELAHVCARLLEQDDSALSENERNEARVLIADIDPDRELGGTDEEWNSSSPRV